MSKLKTAKAVRSFFIFFKWVGIVSLALGAAFLLWLWATHHFLSFAVIFGIILVLFLLGGGVTLWEWSNETIDEAKKEERHAQERNRIEKERRENPGKYVPSFQDDFDGEYH